MFASISTSQWPPEFQHLLELRNELYSLDPVYTLAIHHNALNSYGEGYYRFVLLKYEQTLSTYQHGVSDPRFPVREAPQLIGDFTSPEEVEGMLRLLIGIAKDKKREES